MGAGRTYPRAAAEVKALTDAAVKELPKLTERPDYGVAGVLMPTGPLAEIAGAAAPGWKLLEWGAVTRVVMLIPAGPRPRSFVAAPDFDRWVGPWGEANIDRALGKTLADRLEIVRESRGPFQDAALAEAQLPLMQAVLGGVKLLPLVLGDDTAGQSKRLAQGLLEALPMSESTLIVALGAPPISAAEVLEELDPASLRAARRDGKVAGGPIGAVAALMEMARALRSDPPRPLSARTETPPFVLLMPLARGKEGLFKPPTPAKDDAWTDKLQRDLIEIAKKAVVGHVMMGHKARFATMKGGLAVPSGAYVSVRVDGVLRGQAGTLNPGAPRGQAVADAAYDAALRAKPPLTRRDLSSFEIEVTLPGPVVAVEDVAKIDLQRGGVVVTPPGGERDGVVLPQAALSLGWSTHETLRHACRGAGWPAECRKDPSVKFSTFAARVFRSDPSKPLPPQPPGKAREYGPAGSGLGLAREKLDP